MQAIKPRAKLADHPYHHRGGKARRRVLCLAAVATPASTHDEITGRWQCGRDYIERLAPDDGRSLLVYKNQTAKTHSDSDSEEALVGKGLGAPDSFVPYYDQRENGNLYAKGKRCLKVKSDNK